MNDLDKLNDKKIGIIGLGNVGATIAYTFALSKLFNEIILVDNNKEKAVGEALDISHSIPFLKPMEIKEGSYDDLMDAKIIVITAGSAQKENETRLDLISKNIVIFKSIIGEIKKRDYKGILLIVSNPVDVLTLASLKISGFSKNRVIGSGTVLDSARLQYSLSKHLNIDPRSINAFIIGEHGDSEFPLWSNANVEGIPLSKFCEFKGYFDHEKETDRLANIVRNSAYEIIAKKRATYYGIATSTLRIVKAIINDENTILPISTYLDNEYDLNDICLSILSIINKNGFVSHLPLVLSSEEKDKLINSSNELKESIKNISFE